MGGACGTYRENRYAYRVSEMKPEKRDHLKYLRIDGRIILKCS
jgi:hypothetical protein